MYVKPNPVKKSESGWENFRAKTDNGRVKRPGFMPASFFKVAPKPRSN